MATRALPEPECPLQYDAFKPEVVAAGRGFAVCKHLNFKGTRVPAEPRQIATAAVCLSGSNFTSVFFPT